MESNIKLGEMKMKKVYLETPEAVIKALKEGKEIKDENCYSYKLVDGFIIATTENEIFVGDCIFLNSNPYIVEEKPFEIEVGKWYETRDHQKARCFRVTDRACNCNSFTIDNGFVFNTYKDGKYGVEKECSLDIIGPWRD